MVGNYKNKPGGALYRSELIARAEGGRIQSQSAMNACKKAKDIGADVVKKWSATLDGVTRESHWAVNGEIREIDEKFSNGLIFPHDPAGGAAEVCNCRCCLLQKARWSLEADDTKALGNVSTLSDKRKKQLANKLNIPVDKLDEYSEQIVPINAKSYAEFKQKYNELWHYEGSDVQKQAEARIAGYKAKQKKASNTPKDSKPQVKIYTAKELDKMSETQLKELAINNAIEYYKSGKSGISFGCADVTEAAKALAQQGSKTSLKKDILSIQKKLLENSGNGDIIKSKVPDIEIRRSVGAKALNYDVLDLDTGEIFHFVEGTKIQNVEVFAGKGSSTAYKKAYKYANRYGGNVEDWQHAKGIGWLETDDGDAKAEVHWSQCAGIGKFDFFVKRWLE